MIDELKIGFSDEHRALEAEVARFAREKIEPIERKGGSEDALARRYVAVLAQEGLLRHVFPKELSATAVRFDVRSLCLAMTSALEQPAKAATASRSGPCAPPYRTGISMIGRWPGSSRSATAAHSLSIARSSAARSVNSGSK